MDVEQRVRAAVAALDIDHEMIDCDPELADTAAFCAHYGYDLDRSANTIVVASKRPPGQYAACVVLADTRLDVNKTVKRLMEVRKLSFAPADVTAEVTGMIMGGVTPFALPDDLPLYVDAAVMKRDWVILGGGSRSLKIKISPQALLAVGGQAVTDLANPVPEPL
jgi:prolyl-tRNA editing enzyme YbaK/EbsC (Cys-tRNA(Pro) deacylase)